MYRNYIILFPDDLQALMQKPRLYLKNKELVVVLTGGHNNCREESVPCSDNFGSAVSSEKWLPLPEMPCPRTRHAAAVCTGQLFVVGGSAVTPLFHFNPL